MKRNVLLVLLIIISLWGLAQNFTDSNLPIVVINTDNGVNIPDEPKVPGTMKIIWHQDGSRNYMSDIDNSEFLNYDGRIGIEMRGSSSQTMLDKKPYALETREDDDINNKNVSILGMPAENDWVLNSLAFDQTGMRDVLAYELSNRLGQYASRSVYCEVVINGDYKGLYVFMEKIKPDDNRVNIEKMDASCNNYPEVTGGYITKADKTTGGDPVAWTMQGYGNGWWGTSIEFIHHYPKPVDITNTQSNYIHNVFTNLQSIAGSHNTSIASGIPSVIDIPSFVDFMMIAEYASNVDVYSISTFFHKDRCGKLRAGPVWDYNLAFGYDAFGWNRSRYDVWQFNNQDNNGPKFWKDLFDTNLFRCYLARRWFELTEPGQPLNYDVVCARIEEIDALISEAIARDNQRWNQMTQHAQYVNDMKTWLQQRIDWLNNNIGSDQGCSNVDLPPLVISKIHYHPMNWWGYDGNRLEFIEITNNGDANVDLTGVYFRELGITYKFPNNAHIAGHEAIMLCSDSLMFMEYYNAVPFGQYTRKLSNKSENLVLADAWGNIIDEVCYSDSAPWPTEADGNGAYLQLKDLNADNSLAENWTACEDLWGLKTLVDNQIAIYPNPTLGNIHIVLSDQPKRCQIVDLIGRVLQETTPSTAAFDLDLGGLPSGMYLVKVRFADGSMAFRKVVKR